MATPRAKVLFIEYDPLHVQLIEGIAVTDGGPFDIEIAENLERGLERLSQGGIDLVLLSLVLFNSQGLGAFNKIHTNFPLLPIIVLTANGNEKMAREALDAGAEDYLVKWQADSGALQRSVQRALERRRAAVSPNEQEYAVQRLANALPEAIALYDLKESRLVYGNEQAVRLFGDSIAETRFLNLQAIVHPDDLDGLNTAFERLINDPKGRVSEHEFRIKGGDGDWRWLDCRHSVYRRDDDGQPREILCAAHDITERKRAEELQLLLGSAVHYANDSILITTGQIDPPGPYIVFVNPALSRMTGYAAEELIGKTPRILQGPKTNRRTLQKIRDHLARGESFSGEMVNYRKDGTEYLVEWHISPIRNRNNEITHFVSVQHDVTARRRIVERLREQADLLDNATDAIILLDLEEKVIFWSSGAERLYGWTFNEVKGRRLYDVLYQETPLSLEEIKQTLVSQGKWRGEQTQIAKNGAEIIVESRWTLICDEQNNPRSIFVINTDITEKKRLEAVVLRAQRLESIGALASGIAHDLNNVLAPILMALHTLQQRFTDESSQRWLSLMSKSAERGRDLIERVLAFARGAEGERAPLQTATLIRDISRILKETLPKDIELQVQVPDDLWSVIGDTTQIHQVLMNLCINARDAMPRGGRLLIKARNRYLVEEEKRLVTNPFQKQYVRITVADTGVGIPPEIIDRVFDPFFTTKEKGKGSGLGLSTVMSIVRGHGGFVNVLSKVGKGTEFKVYLPAQDAAAAEVGVVDQVDLPAGKGELILVVDDEADLREITSTTLEECGYRVLSAGNGREALDIYRQYENEIQLVVTDMVMPHLDGPATIRALRQINPDLKVIATSGVKSTGQLVDVMKLGIKAFLTKPYTAERLLAAVAESLNGQPAQN